MAGRRSAGEPIGLGGDVMTRVFGAPRELVFEVWTRAEHFRRWFGPHGAEVVDCELDARPGGIIRFGHRFPDWTVHVKGGFREVVLKERLDFSIGFVDELGRPGRHPMFPDWPLDAMMECTVTFEAVEGGTRVTVVQSVSPSALASHPSVKRNLELAREGWSQVLDRLGEHLFTARSQRKHGT